MLHSFKIVYLIAFVFFLSACTTDIVKSVDEQMSELAGTKCSATNLSVGEDYCQAPKLEYIQVPVYCYKTMGGVDCYRKPNPYHAESAERVRPALSLGSHGADIMTAEEFELRQIMAKETIAQAKKQD
jgi:hypothetical protein